MTNKEILTSNGFEILEKDGVVCAVWGVHVNDDDGEFDFFEAFEESVSNLRQEVACLGKNRLKQIRETLGYKGRLNTREWLSGIFGYYGVDWMFGETYAHLNLDEAQTLLTAYGRE